MLHWLPPMDKIGVDPREREIGRRYRRIDWPVEQIRKWVEKDGLKHREVGVRLKTSDKMISKVCKRHGIQSQRRGPRSGPEHPDWRGGVCIDKNGYRLIYSPGHPFAKKPVPYVREHRLVMEKHLKRYLLPTEVVHHKNGEKQDNRIENLELFEKNSDHLRYELKGKIPKWSSEGRKRILERVRSKEHIDQIRRLGESMRLRKNRYLKDQTDKVCPSSF